jgi:rhomboid family GlyGly-CTERM serine protease
VNDTTRRDGAQVAWWRRPGRAWLALAGLLALGGALGYGRPEATLASLDWQPALALAEPWRMLSAAFVHYSLLHLIGNAAGLALTAAYGWVARVPPRIALAWLVAWPLTQLGLLVQPGLLHYGGVSGVVHAGVAIVTLHVIVAGHRWVGGTILVMLFVKLATESPFGAPLQHVSGWDIALAPIAHATGVAAGLLCGAVAEALARAAKTGREEGRQAGRPDAAS